MKEGGYINLTQQAELKCRHLTFDDIVSSILRNFTHNLIDKLDLKYSDQEKIVLFEGKASLPGKVLLMTS